MHICMMRTKIRASSGDESTTGLLAGIEKKEICRGRQKFLRALTIFIESVMSPFSSFPIEK